MSNNNGIELSRRKALAGIGGIGVASAGAGLGTSAYFNDEENFEDNVLTAGELDLVLDWQEQYSAAADTKGFDNVRFVDPESTSARDLGDHEMGIPTQENPSVAVDTSSTSGTNEVTVTEYMAATAIDSFPDTDGRDIGDVDGDGSTESGTGTADDGVQDDIPINDGEGSESAECQYLQPLIPDDGVLSSSARTQASQTPIGNGPNPQTTASGDSLVSITDVKPGDFGEVTFSLHLCGNPGYISMTGNLVNGDPELLNAAKGVIWYDAGDNGEFDDTSAEPTEGDNILQNDYEDVVGAPGNTIFRGPLATVLNLLEPDPGIPLDGDLRTSFAEIEPKGANATTVSDTEEFSEKFTRKTSEDGPTKCTVIEPDDETHYGESVKLEQDVGEISNRIEDAKDSDTDESDYVSYTDEGDVVTELGDGGITVATHGGSFKDGNTTEPQTITLSTDKAITGVIVKGGTGKGGGGDDVIVYREQDGAVLNEVEFTAPNDTALSFVEICYEPKSGDPAEREPFPNSTTAFIGFAWWLPPSVGNEVQGQSLEFDIGFMTEQARHNDDPSV